MELGFVLKKLVSVFIMPLSIGLILFFIGLILLYQNKQKYSKIFLTISFLWIIIFSHTTFSNLLIKPLENKYSTLQTIPNNIKYILILGGDKQNRSWEAIRLYNLISNAKIITSGFKGNQKDSEANLTAKLLINSGIPQKDIIIHHQPKDTKDEAIQMKKLVGKEKFILVTSSFHMPRAMAIFEGEGLNPIASSTNFLQNHKNDILSIPNSGDLQKSTIAWHEYIGIIWAKIRGQI
jgi:uncharacterized SAM-binding protein YcdF (DUF218 family)